MMRSVYLKHIDHFWLLLNQMIQNKDERSFEIKNLFKLMTIFLLSMLLAACATTPTWKDMSEHEIAAWQQLGLDAQDAQDFKKAGLGPDDIQNWYGVGIKDKEEIFSWHRKGFKYDEAADWRQNDFSTDEAATWRDKQFSAEEAGKWKKAKFDLDDAVKNREKGLQPIHD